MRSGLLKALGPGIVLAAASIGGSHLVASTQAGALYGLGLLGLLLLANLFKYPFLLIGSRFTAVTGRSLLEGYQHQSPWFLPLYLLITQHGRRQHRSCQLLGGQLGHCVDARHTAGFGVAGTVALPGGLAAGSIPQPGSAQ